MAIYFKFNSWNNSQFDTIPLDITTSFMNVGELKQAIIQKKKIDKNNGLVLTNAQTNEGWILFLFIYFNKIYILFFLKKKINILIFLFYFILLLDYKEDSQIVPKNTSVIVRLVPLNQIITSQQKIITQKIKLKPMYIIFPFIFLF